MSDRIIRERGTMRTVHKLAQGLPGPPGQLDADVLAALTGANAPDAGNPFATIDDVGTEVLDYDTEPPPAIVDGQLYYRRRDTTAPVVTAFTLPETAVTLTVTISSLTATDARGVTGYYFSESAVAPTVGSVWLPTNITTVTFSGQGTRTMYVWARDEAGNISDYAAASVEITLPNQAPSASIAVTSASISGFTAAGTVYGIGAGDSINKIRVVWMRFGIDADEAEAIAAGRYTDLTTSGDKTSYQGGGKAISATLPVGIYIPCVQVTENMSGGGTQSGVFARGAQFEANLGIPQNVVADAGDGSAFVDFDLVTGASTYNAYWTNNGDDPAPDQPIDANHGKLSGVVPQFVHSSLTNGTLYKYGITAVSTSEGGISAIASVTPVATWSMGRYKEPATAAFSASQTQSYANGVWTSNIIAGENVKNYQNARSQNFGISLLDVVTSLTITANGDFLQIGTNGDDMAIGFIDAPRADGDYGVTWWAASQNYVAILTSTTASNRVFVGYKQFSGDGVTAGTSNIPGNSGNFDATITLTRNGNNWNIAFALNGYNQSFTNIDLSMFDNVIYPFMIAGNYNSTVLIEHHINSFTVTKN